MPKDIIVECYSTPDRLGYNDKLAIVMGNEVIWHCQCSACPNPFRPSDQKPWREAYGWIAPGEHKYECVNPPAKHPEWGRCLLINGGGIVPARLPNPNHDGKLVLSELFVHPGGLGKNRLWRGSGGCTTLEKEVFDRFITFFPLGSSGKICYVDLFPLS